MKNLQKYTLILMGFSLSFANTVQADEVCPHCAAIRQFNAEHHKNYNYYEEYLKDESDGKTDGNMTFDNQQPTTTQEPAKNQEVRKNIEIIKHRNQPQANKNSTNKNQDSIAPQTVKPTKN